MSEDRLLFEELWRENFDYLSKYARRRLRTEDASREAVAEAFGNAWLQRKKMPPGAKARQLWLTRLTFHAVCNIQYREHRQSRLLGRLLREPQPDVGVWPSSLDDAQVRLMRAIAGLKQQDQELIRLANWEKLSHEDIAVIMDMTPGNVAVRLHRARHALRKALENPGSPKMEPGGRPRPAAQGDGQGAQS